jgi:multisubunit Na+/H+ antiporter MnhG subunit
MFRKLPEFRHFSTSSLGGAMSDNNPGSQGNSPYGQNPPQYGQNPPQYGQNQPQYGQNPPQYGQSASPYGQQGPYGSGAGNYPGQQGYQGQPAENPGRTLGIIGFILAILIAPVGLIISIVALVKSRRARMGNGFALAGIIIGALFTILGVIGLILFASFAADLTQQILQACEGQPTGTPVTVQGQPVECP